MRFRKLRDTIYIAVRARISNNNAKKIMGKVCAMPVVLDFGGVLQFKSILGRFLVQYVSFSP